jgi:hypothetical protein
LQSLGFLHNAATLLLAPLAPLSGRAVLTAVPCSLPATQQQWQHQQQ